MRNYTKSLIVLSVIVGLLIATLPPAVAAPAVSITGLDGAAHWLWVEAEDATAIYQGGAGFRYVSGISGFREVPTFPNNYIQQEWRDGAPWIRWQLRLPGAMPEGARLLAQAGSHYGKGVDVILDGVKVSEFNSLPVGQWGEVTGWAQATLPPIPAGVHTLELSANAGYEIYGWDGVLLYGGGIGVTGHPFTVSGPAGTYWMGANMTPTGWQIIRTNSVTPQFSVGGAIAAAYWLSKDGTAYSYQPGTAIQGYGRYRVWAEAHSSVLPQNISVPQGRVIAGADFELAPNETNPKLGLDGDSVSINYAVVTAAFPSYLYIEASDRSFGIRVNKSYHGVTLPARVDVSGVLRTSADGERYIEAGSVVVSGSATIDPIAMNCRALGGGDFHHIASAPKSGQAGVDGGAGLNNIGMLVRVCGVLTPVSTNKAFLDDGSGAEVSVAAPLTANFPEMSAPYPYVTLTGISSCERDSSTGKLRRLIRLRSLADIGWLTPRMASLFAAYEPDMQVSPGDGNANASLITYGGHVRMILFGDGGPSNRITDVLVNGVSLNDAFIARTPANKNYTIYSTLLGPANPQLQSAGDPVWYRILPIDGPLGTNTQILIRLRNVPTQTISVAARRADGSLVQTTVTPSSALVPRFGLITVDKQRSNVIAYVLLPNGSTPITVTDVYLDRADVTSRSVLPGGFYPSGVLPLSIQPQVALDEGSYHVLECRLSDGRQLAAAFRANNGFATAMFGGCNAYVVTDGWNSLGLRGTVGAMDSVGKRWEAKIATVGTRLNYGIFVKSSASAPNSMHVKLLPDASSGGVRIDTTENGTTRSALAQYVDGPDGDWIAPNELHDGDILSIGCISRTGNTRVYAAYLNGHQLKWWSGASYGAGRSEFAMPVELDQPGLMSYDPPADFAIDRLSLLPDVRSAGLMTDFSEQLLDSHLEESEAGTWTVQDGECYHTKKSTRNYGRTYIRTIRGDYNTGDWTYEVTFNRYSQTPQDYKYIGLGDGVPSSTYYGLPAGVFFAPDVSATGQMNVYKYNGATGQQAQLVGSCGAFPGWGNERVRITKSGQSLSFQVDFNYAGGAFVADGSTVTVNLSDPYFSFLNASNSKLFFGCTEAANDWFDDMSVSAAQLGSPFVDDFASNQMFANYVMEGTSEAGWTVDPAPVGTVSLDCAVPMRPMISDLESHYFDAWLGYSSEPAFQNVARDAGVRLSPNLQELSFAQARAVADPDADIYSYYLFDEPDCVDHYVGTEWGIGSGEWNGLRLGLHGQYLVKLCEVLREADPKHSTLLNTDLTYEPANYFYYGQLADIACSDYYYPNSAPDTNWDPLPFMYNKTRQHRSGCMPHPSIRFMLAGPLCGLIPSQYCRAPFAGEQRVMAYGAAAGGGNGLYYFWYHCDPQYGCQYQTELWAETVNINREYQLLAPYIGISFPISLAATTPPKIWVRTVAAGPDTLLCVVVNKDYVSAPESFTYNPAPAGKIVTLTKPAGFTVNSAVTVTPAGPAALAFTQNAGSITFDAGPMELGRYVLLSARSNLLAELQARW